MNYENAQRVIAEAEKILAEEYPKARAEVCPQGSECPVHFRVDDEYIDQSIWYARLITYVGDYVVITEDNNQLGNPAVMAKVLSGAARKDEMPDRWETTILHIGSGVISDLTLMNEAQQRRALRYLKTHNDWDGIIARHRATTYLLSRGMINVSKPLEG